MSARPTKGRPARPTKGGPPAKPYVDKQPDRDVEQPRPARDNRDPLDERRTAAGILSSLGVPAALLRDAGHANRALAAAAARRFRRGQG